MDSKGVATLPYYWDFDHYGLVAPGQSDYDLCDLYGHGYGSHILILSEPSSLLLDGSLI